MGPSGCWQDTNSRGKCRLCLGPRCGRDAPQSAADPKFSPSQRGLGKALVFETRRPKLMSPDVVGACPSHRNGHGTTRGQGRPLKAVVQQVGSISGHTFGIHLGIPDPESTRRTNGRDDVVRENAIGSPCISGLLHPCVPPPPACPVSVLGRVSKRAWTLCG